VKQSRYYAWFCFQKGTVGIVSKSGTLTYEAADQVVKQGLGITTAIGIEEIQSLELLQEAGAVDE
jgi:succinyl-CoA synthetase alpha subunit